TSISLYKLAPRLTTQHESLNENKKNKKIIVVLLVLAAVIGIAVYNAAGKRKPATVLGENVSNPVATSSVEETVRDGKSIAIPGYQGINLKANTKQQDVALKNPEVNTCLFVVTLALEDGTELWTSSYIKPGEISDCIELNQELEEGTYENASLIYKCYTVDDKRPLNGAETKLTLRVKK
ncbi:MAG: hypothetical protein Q4B26_21045, partial [Eubacteriales bacterium]|nr:hypothetical protein [Eubacteriales bacterium]